MFHGGGFTDCTGVNDNPLDDEQKNDDVITICQELAHKGFIAFDVEYRRGNYTDSMYITAQSPLAIYRTQQDARGAIRCIIERQNYQTAHTQTDDYKVDVNTIFLGGNSAGSITAMTSDYYYRQSKIDSILPGVATVLSSSINPDYYAPDVNNSSITYNATLDYRPSIKGILNDWGVVYIHKAFASFPGNFFLNNDGYNPPIISFYGLKDNYLLPGLTPQYYAPANAVFIRNGTPTTISIHSESNCLGTCLSSSTTYTVNPDLGNADIYSIGSEKIYNILSGKDTATLLYRDCQMKHGLDDNCGAGCYQSDFGTGDTDKADTYKYIAARAANFFQVVIHYGSANHYLNSIRFTDCEDYRHLCEITDHDNGCINGQTCP